MNVYIFQAALYCETCAQAVKSALAAQGKTPANVDDETAYDSDDYPKGPYPDGGGESDAPQHCDSCQLFLENPLTRDGTAYVKSSLSEHEMTGRGSFEVLNLWKDFYSL